MGSGEPWVSQKNKGSAVPDSWKTRFHEIKYGGFHWNITLTGLTRSGLSVRPNRRYFDKPLDVAYCPPPPTFKKSTPWFVRNITLTLNYTLVAHAPCLPFCKSNTLNSLSFQIHPSATLLNPFDLKILLITCTFTWFQVSINFQKTEFLHCLSSSLVCWSTIGKLSLWNNSWSHVSPVE